mmetsp:Transcript_19469/g.41069  ORF Transcript_19469/g.41069 Transcript_19469/m.41069 type:complete len:258 (+) Transcript_19469:916-1689(+)
MPPDSCKSSSSSMAPSSHSLINCSVYPHNNANARALRPACCRVPNMPNTALRNNRSSQASLLTIVRNFTCRSRSTLTVVETSVAKAIEITGINTPVIVGLSRLFANVLPSTDLMTPYMSKNSDKPKLIFSHPTNANSAGTKARIKKLISCRSRSSSSSSALAASHRASRSRRTSDRARRTSSIFSLLSPRLTIVAILSSTGEALEERGDAVRRGDFTKGPPRQNDGWAKPRACGSEDKRRTEMSGSSMVDRKSHYLC